MHSQHGREPLASKLADDLENPGFVSGLKSTALLAPLADAIGLHVPLDLHRDIGGGARVRAGIEFNGAGQRTAYWVMRDRPGDPLTSLRLEPLRLPSMKRFSSAGVVSR